MKYLGHPLFNDATYGGDKAAFSFGSDGVGPISGTKTNLITNTGVIGADITLVGTARYYLAAAGYGADKGIFGYGYDGSSRVSMTNLMTNVGVIGTDVTGVGTARQGLAAAGYSGAA